MKKSEILREFFSNRIISYHREGKKNLLVVEVKDLIRYDFSPRFLQCIIEIIATSNETIKVIFEVDEWD